MLLLSLNYSSIVVYLGLHRFEGFSRLQEPGELAICSSHCFGYITIVLNCVMVV